MKHKKNKRVKDGIPRDSARLDSELIEDIKMYYNLGNSLEKTAQVYKIPVELVVYCLKQNNNNKEGMK